jgi:hypothetical protein
LQQEQRPKRRYASCQRHDSGVGCSGGTGRYDPGARERRGRFGSWRLGYSCLRCCSGFGCEPVSSSQAERQEKTGLWAGFFVSGPIEHAFVSVVGVFF